MEQNISMFMKENLSTILLFMFGFLAVIIFFIVTSEEENDYKYCLVDVDDENHEDKKCKRVRFDKECHNEFSTKKKCKKWKNALKYSKSKKNKKNKKYKYSTDAIDDLTLMSSDDMIYCLKKDKTCKKMSFKKCRKKHIDTYLSKGNCKKAKKQLKEKEEGEETDTVTPGPSVGDHVNNYLRKLRRKN